MEMALLPCVAFVSKTEIKAAVARLTVNWFIYTVRCLSSLKKSLVRMTKNTHNTNTRWRPSGIIYMWMALLPCVAFMSEAVASSTVIYFVNPVACLNMLCSHKKSPNIYERTRTRKVSPEDTSINT